jgi:putative ABC transport system ATP-binding protein
MSANSNRPVAIELTNVSKVFSAKPENISAVQDISLAAQYGEFIAIMGPSGSGKSTLINIMAGLDRPTSGEIRLEGSIVDSHDLDAFAEVRLQKIGVVFQDHHLLEELLVEENVGLPLELMRWQREAVAEEVAQRLKAVGVAELSRRLPSEISGGQRQRVGIARALAGGKRILLADEPTGALDSKNSVQVAKIFQSAAAEGVLVFVATHDFQVAKFATRIIHIQDGCLVEGTV